jgi:hypothetical protein
MKALCAGVVVILWLISCSRGQTIPQNCTSSLLLFQELTYKYNPDRQGAPSANLRTIESELGKASRVEPDSGNSGSKAVYILHGCVGEVVFDDKGKFLTTRFRTDSANPPTDVKVEGHSSGTSEPRSEAYTVTSQRSPASSAPASAGESVHSTPGTEVQVRGYYRKDGTYVAPHTRSKPGTKKKKTVE